MVFFRNPVNGNQVLCEKQGGTFTAAYAWGNGLIRRNTEYVFTDGQGNERTVTNSSQTVTGTLLQDASGLTVATTGSSTKLYISTRSWCFLWSRPLDACTAMPRSL
jgi:hypothetical protein